jgi:hypothetical protein
MGDNFFERAKAANQGSDDQPQETFFDKARRANQGGAGQSSLPGTSNSGFTVDGKPVQFWTGAATPGSLQTNLGPANTGQASLANGASQAQSYQTGLLQQLQDQSQGKGLSLAQQQLQAGTDQNLRQQAAVAAGGRNPGLASYQAAQNQSAAGQQMAGQASQARLAEQLQAQQQLAGLSSGMRQQDIGLGEFNAQQQQQMGLANMGAQNQFGLQQGQMSQQALQYYNALMSGQLGSYNQYMYGAAQQQAQQDAAMKQAVLGGAMNAGSAGLGLLTSDEQAKTDVQPGAPLVRDMLDQLKAHDYEYKDPKQPGADEGRHVSVMAQELEKSELGRRLVKETPTGKQVDYGRGLGTMLAALADMNARVKEIEARKNTRKAG